jgi:hypothetical protein
MRIKPIMLKSLFHQLVPQSIRMEISEMRGTNSHPVGYMNSNNYLSALVAVSTYFSEQQSITDEALKPLHQAFSANDVRSYLLKKEWWADFVFAATNLDDKTEETQDKLIAQINQLPLNTFKHWELLHLSSLALRVGLFMVGYAMRCKAREVAMDYLRREKKPSRSERIAAIAALMETGKYEEARNHISSLGNDCIKQKQLLSYLYGLMTTESDPELMFNSTLNDSEQDRAFRQFVQGKSIALVGPAKTDQPDAIEIDSYDLVMRCNYKEKGIGVDDTVKGLRCNITGFRTYQVSSLCNQDNIKWDHQIEWVVCHTLAEQVDKKVNQLSVQDQDQASLTNSHNLETRDIKTIQEEIRGVLFVNQSWLNAIPNYVLDLLRFSPGVVKVFHTDLMLTKERHFKYYSSDVEANCLPKQRDLKEFSAAHDPVTQYWLLHQLWQGDKIKGDSRFNEVMYMGEKEYMRQLQLIYGSAGRL